MSLLYVLTIYIIGLGCFYDVIYMIILNLVNNLYFKISYFFRIVNFKKI